MWAMSENLEALRILLQATPPPYGGQPVSDPARIIAEIHAAAPPEALPFNGIYAPGAQLELGVMVLEDSIKRHVDTLGVEMQRVRPARVSAMVSGSRAGTAHAMVANLEAIDANLDTYAQQWSKAVARRDQPLTADPAVPTETAAAATESSRAATRDTSSRRLPDHLRAVLRPFRDRDERHMIHLALHSGRMNAIPAAVLDLPPEAFSTQRHANTWRAIQAVQARGDSVNYVSVSRELASDAYAGVPVLDGNAFRQMFGPPEIKPDRIARSLDKFVSTALSRAGRERSRAVGTAVRAPGLSVDEILSQAKSQVHTLADQARAAADRHKTIDRYRADVRVGTSSDQPRTTGRTAG